MSIMEFGQRSFITWTAEDLRKERLAEKENIQMSREIKVRAWDTKRKKMWSAEEMGKDQLTLMPDGRGFINVDGTSTALSQFCPHLIPMQFTGLKDKNSKEIYADDKMQSKDGLRRYVVTWSKAQGYWYLKGLEAAWAVNTPMWEDYEVIGNKWEHPELLEQENDSKNTRQIER